MPRFCDSLIGWKQETIAIETRRESKTIWALSGNCWPFLKNVYYMKLFGGEVKYRENFGAKFGKQMDCAKWLFS